MDVDLQAEMKYRANDFHSRKALRTYYFMKYRYKNKLIECDACSGSGYYDDRWNGCKCIWCNGTGRRRER